MAATPADLDARAQRLLRVGLASAVLLHDGDPETARRALRPLTHDELVDVSTLLAACVDIEKTETELLAWWTSTQAAVIPEHADERYGDAPPLRIGTPSTHEQPEHQCSS